ncbi:MAG: hypothetical protein OEW05_03240 [Candidatus Aminicenantes bacterium]|nr:hypothetical protein [Candidatus Aminicenantes bacterium]
MNGPHLSPRERPAGRGGRRRSLAGLVVAAALLPFLAGLLPAATVIMPLAQVKPGMKGVGRSVFQGGRVEEFGVEILGILRNVQPKRDAIMARLSGQGLEETGVLQGMSGSPVFIDGKIIGAVAYSYAFAKSPIAGITPIEEMLAVQTQPAAPRPAVPSRIPLTNSLSLTDLAELYRAASAGGETVQAEGQALVRLRLPLVFNGFSSRAFEAAKPFFTSLGFTPLRGGGTGQAETPAVAPVREGDSVAAQLIAGDLDLSAVGTVTYVDGNRLLAFGHPFYNLGRVDYGLARADVITVVPSLETSFKVAAPGAPLGRISQDRTVGVLGEVGQLPVMIPLNISLEGAPLVRREFKLRLVNDRILSAALVNLAVASLISSEERDYGDLSLDFDADIYLDRGRVHLEDLFSGNYNNATTSVAGIMAAVTYFLTNNEFQDVGIFRIDLNVRSRQDARLSALDRVLLDKYEASPGEQISVKVFYRTFKQENLLEEVEIVTPDLPAGSEFQLIVGDAAAMHQVEQGLYRTTDFVPRSFEQLLRLLSNLRKNNRIYFKIVAPRPGLFLKGEELPNLPPTLKSVFASPRATSSAPTELLRSTLGEFQIPIPYVFRGVTVVPVKIRK